MIYEGYLITYLRIDIVILALTKVYILRVLTSRLGEIKVSKKLYNAMCIVVFWLIILIKQKQNYSEILNLLGAVVICIMLTVSFDASIIQKAMIMIIWNTIVILSEVLMESMSYYIANTGLIKEYTSLKIACALVILFIVIIVKWGIRICKDFSSCVDNDKWIDKYILLPLIINASTMIIIFYYGRGSKMYHKPDFIIIIFMIFGLLLSSVLFVILGTKLNSIYEKEKEYKYLQRQMEMDYEYYLRLEEEQERIRLLYHDINNHLACIREIYIEQHGKGERYIHELENEIVGLKMSFRTGSNVVDAILRQKSIICDKREINLIVRLELGIYNFIEDKDLCSIFANILDNAIEAVNEVSDKTKRYICIESQQRKEILIIQVKNGKDHINTWENTRLITRKKDKILHGLGLKSVRNALERYNGEYIIKEEADSFCIKMMIPIPKM